MLIACVCYVRMFRSSTQSSYRYSYMELVVKPREVCLVFILLTIGCVCMHNLSTVILNQSPNGTIM